MLNPTAVSVDEDFTAAFLRDPTATIVGMPTEEILLDAGENDEIVAAPVESGAVRDEVSFENKLRGTVTELTFLDDGFLEVSLKRRRGPIKEYTVDLRYLSPRPALLRIDAPKTLKIASAITAAGLLSSALAYFIGTWTAALVAIAICTAAAAAVGCYLYRKHERVEFVTRHGQATVLTLYANFGCSQRCRALVPKIIEAIQESSDAMSPADDRYLKGEVQEHYRLRESGVIPGPACTAAAKRVLTYFR